MTGRAPAHLNVVTPERLEAELVVEGGAAVPLAGRQFQMLADADDRFTGEVSAGFLDFLEERDETVAASRLVLADNGFDVWRNHDAEPRSRVPPGVRAGGYS